MQSKNTVKTRIILGIGLNVLERPRELQQIAGTNEHHVVHELYMLNRQGLVAFQKRRNAHSSGTNLTKIRLTDQGQKLYRSMKR